MLIDKIADNIWSIEGSCVNFHGFPYPTRSVIVRLQNDELWFWSPVRFNNELAAKIDELGKLAHLVSPNKIHHLFLSDWSERYSNAKLWGPDSTIRKRRDLNFSAPLSAKAPAEWTGQLEQFHVCGSLVMDEILFLHVSSRTLIMADFSEHYSPEFLDKHWKPWQRVLARCWGIVEGKGYAPLDWRMSFLNRRRLKELKKTLLDRDIENVIMAHGTVVTGSGRDFLKRSLAWI